MVEFDVAWDVTSEGDFRILRFRARAGQHWDKFSKRLGLFVPLTVVQKSDPLNVAKAMKAQQRQEGTVTAESESADDQACYTLAKALGELPRLVDSRPVRCVAVAPEGKVRVHVWIDHLRAEMQGKAETP
mmetsp:Transcript_70285/g.126685  ORF Transcript_70285/g.126685 Transcript_70285/m.126685 type:complete len:130 (-) Transcript_70285:115-504(-)